MDNIKTKVIHSKSKSAWNVVSTTLGSKYKIARVPYVKVEGDVVMTEIQSSEALRIANFISESFNKQ